MHHVRLRGLLQCLDRRALPAQVWLVPGFDHHGAIVGRDLTHEPGEGELADQELGRLLVAADLAQGACAGAVAAGAATGEGVAGCFGGRRPG